MKWYSFQRLQKKISSDLDTDIDMDIELYQTLQCKRIVLAQLVNTSKAFHITLCVSVHPFACHNLYELIGASTHFPNPKRTYFNKGRSKWLLYQLNWALPILLRHVVVSPLKVQGQFGLNLVYTTLRTRAFIVVKIGRAGPQGGNLPVYIFRHLHYLRCTQLRNQLINRLHVLE